MTAALPSFASTAMIQHFRSRLQTDRPVRRVGRVQRVTGLLIESEGPNLALGDVCSIESPGDDAPVFAEVVGFRDHRLLLMPLGETERLRSGCDVVASSVASQVPVGSALLGRILNGLGLPMDGKGPLNCERQKHLHNAPPDPLTRQRIREPLATGVRAIDAFTPVGVGQRLEIGRAHV